MRVRVRILGQKKIVFKKNLPISNNHHHHHYQTSEKKFSLIFIHKRSVGDVSYIDLSVDHNRNGLLEQIISNKDWSCCNCIVYCSVICPSTSSLITSVIFLVSTCVMGEPRTGESWTKLWRLNLSNNNVMESLRPYWWWFCDMYEDVMVSYMFFL